MSNWQMVLLEPAKVILAQIGQFVADVFLVIFLFILGWLFARLVKTLITRILRALKIDEVSDSIELDNLLAKGGIKYSLSELLGVIAYWLAILITAVVVANAVNLPVVADLLNKVVQYIPSVIASVLILILGMFVAKFLRNTVQTIAANAGIAEGSLLGRIVEAIILIFAVAIAMEQLNIGAKTIQLTLSIILGAIGLALAIAFGLGCKDIAAKCVSEWVDKIKSDK